MNKSKLLGQVDTPEWIVQIILNETQYMGHTILQKYVLEPSCGNGVFLIEIIKRYIQEAKLAQLSNQEIINHLQTYIYGFEIDSIRFQECLDNLNKLVGQELNIPTIQLNWKIFCTDTLKEYSKYSQFFDFIVGNPPYIRIHNLDEWTRQFIKQNLHFSKGTIDIYVSFFEISLLMLNNTGKLGFITPNSFLHNHSYQNFRAFLSEKSCIKMLCDFKAYKVFKGYSTYTAITVIDHSQKQPDFEYKELTNTQTLTIDTVNQINWNDLNDKKWILSNRHNELFLNQLFENKNTYLKELFDIQYGFATLRDKIFINPAENETHDKIQFNGQWLERNIFRKIVKGSRYKGDGVDMEYVLFPYHLTENGKYIPYTEYELKQQFPLAYQYLLSYKTELLQRDLDKNTLWYEFGRSQGIQTSHRPKIVVNTLVNGSVQFFRLPENIFVYSGIFVSAKYDESDLELVEQVLSSDNFFRYVRLTGKDFSGGYKSLSTKQIKEYRIDIPNPLCLF